MTLPDIIVALLGGVPSSPHILLVPFYQLAAISLGLKFLILSGQRKVRNAAREMIYD
jgi:hypothetical protein